MYWQVLATEGCQPARIFMKLLQDMLVIICNNFASLVRRSHLCFILAGWTVTTVVTAGITAAPSSLSPALQLINCPHLTTVAHTF